MLFELASVDGRQIRLRVIESGISTLDLTDEERAAHPAMTSEGWDSGLPALVAYAQQSSV